MAIQDKRTATSAQNLWGWEEDDTIFGSRFGDTLAGAQGDDVIVGGDGDDTIRDWTTDLAGQVHEDGRDRFEGGDGDDTIFTGSDDDVALGGADNDRIATWAGNDYINGGSGRDTLDGGFGDDTIDGGEGNDTIRLNFGSDTINGGSGRDTLLLSSFIDGKPPVGFGVTEITIDSLGDITQRRLDLETGEFSIFGTLSVLDATVDITSVEVFNLGNVSSVFRGNDDGQSILGGSFQDLIEGRGGADVIDGGGSTDTASYSSSAQGVIVNLDLSVQRGGDAEGDRLVNIENIAGSAFADTLMGDRNTNILSGGGGRDLMDGGNGIDQLDGEAGNDTIVGGGNTDFIIGGTGIDTLFGGVGEDVFRFRSLADFRPDLDGLAISSLAGKLGTATNLTGLTGVQSGKLSPALDTIMDFEIGRDTINFFEIDADTGRSGNQNFDDALLAEFTGRAGEIAVSYVGSGDSRKAIVSGDVTGDGKADFSLAVVVGNGFLSESDFSF